MAHPSPATNCEASRQKKRGSRSKPRSRVRCDPPSGDGFTRALRGLCPERSTLRTLLPVCQRSKVGLPLFPGRVTQVDAGHRNLANATALLDYLLTTCRPIAADRLLPTDYCSLTSHRPTAIGLQSATAIWPTVSGHDPHACFGVTPADSTALATAALATAALAPTWSPALASIRGIGTAASLSHARLSHETSRARPPGGRPVGALDLQHGVALSAPRVL
jgi:hypothetical protein